MELIPKPIKIIKIVNESADVKSFIFKLPENGKVEFLPGNFVKISLQGVGESTFAISRIFPGEKCFAVSVKRTGYHTKMLHRTGLEQIVGFRGPYGNSFPVSEWHGNNIVIIGGGIGFAPLRPLIDYILNNRNQYGKLTIFFGARSPSDILYKEDLKKWDHEPELDLYITVDVPSKGWTKQTGFVPDIIKDIHVNPDNGIAVICGPPVMITKTLDVLANAHWIKEQIYTTLEMKMQCGIGQCGRCNIGGTLICKHGPVFRMDKIESM